LKYHPECRRYCAYFTFTSYIFFRENDMGMPFIFLFHSTRDDYIEMKLIMIDNKGNENKKKRSEILF